MGLAEWLFGGGDDRSSFHSDLQNSRSKAHNKIRVTMLANQAAQQRRVDAARKADRAKAEQAKKDKEAAERARKYRGSRSGSHPRGGHWWD